MYVFRGISEAKQPAQSQHQSAVKELQEKHKLELDKLRKELAKELEKAKAELAQEQKVELASFREQLVREQLSEEKKLRAEKAAAVSELRSKVTDERDEEEARLEEEKQDYLRKIRQQVRERFCACNRSKSTNYHYILDQSYFVCVSTLPLYFLYSSSPMKERERRNDSKVRTARHHMSSRSNSGKRRTRLNLRLGQQQPLS